MHPDVLAKIEEFFGRYPIQHQKKGHILILHGTDPGHVFKLAEGRVKQYDVTPRGDEIILNVFKPPAFFPMSLAINPAPSQHIFEAETDIQIHQAPAKDVLEFVKSNPDVMFDLLTRLYRGMDGVLGRMAQLMSGSAKGRLMYEVLLSCRRFGEHTAEGDCVITLNESDLGKRAGLTRETVSREMRKLQDKKLLTVASGKITVYDLSAFEKALGVQAIN